MMLSQLLISFVSLVDIGMVGRLGTEEQAAVGYATQFHFLTQSVFFAIGFACVARMARAIGGGDLERARQALAAALVLAPGAGLIFAGLIGLFPVTILGWLGASDTVAALCAPYLRLTMLSSLLLAVALTVESGLRADRDTKTSMRIAVFVTATKVALNALLIFGLWGFPRLELVGAGLATLASQGIALVLFGIVLKRAREDGPLALRLRHFTQVREFIREGGEFRRLARLAYPSIIERVGMNLALLVFFAVLSGYGAVAIASYTVGIRLLSFSWIPGIGYAQAVATLVGQSIGRNDLGAARHAGWRAARLAVGTALVMGILGAWLRVPLAELFSRDPATIATLVPFMLAMCLCQPTLQLHFTLAGAHRGAG
ncbi:MAG: MATE family efflux transporter, partial [Myxococcales bacterium]|nr:MATE family efflux transporter [Myxococcales bacterium]